MKANDINLPSPSLLARKQRRYAIALCVAIAAYFAVASYCQGHLDVPINKALERVGLAGLGAFAWIFLALLGVSSYVFNHLGAKLEETKGLLRDYSRGRISAESFFRVWQECAQNDWTLPEVSSAEEVSRAISEDESLLGRVLSFHLGRLNIVANRTSAWLKEVVGNLQLFGTAAGMGSAIAAMSQSAKGAALAGGQRIAAMGATPLAAAFAVTMAGCLVVIVISSAISLRLGTRLESALLGLHLLLEKQMTEVAKEACVPGSQWSRLGTAGETWIRRRGNAAAPGAEGEGQGWST